MFACARRWGHGGLEGSVIHVRSAGGIGRGFVVNVCMSCQDPPCARACPTDALIAREGGGVRFKAEECLGCGNCAEACPFNAIMWDTQKNKPQVCVHCGTCAQYCPYNVIALIDIKEVNENVSQ
ncbi:MAG: 4Fe-4S binding protein [Anaerolineae bacterium]|nr:4Fe-4S binding protein [Anaerolineae bacterium]